MLKTVLTILTILTVSSCATKYSVIHVPLQAQENCIFEKFTTDEKAQMLELFDFEKFLKAIEEANILIDFDARTGHNHGTKFRLRQNCLPMLYKKTTVLF